MKLTNFKRTEKVWGWEEEVWNEEYCMKKLFIEAGHSTSYHHHNIKDEVMYVVSGELNVTYSEKLWKESKRSEISSDTLFPGEAFHIKTGLHHSLKAYKDTLLIECSTHSEDSDSIREFPGY